MTRLPIPAPVITRDPLWWQVGLAGLFAVLVFWHLGTPSKIYFDEVHYVAAARAMLEGTLANPEHPLFAKTLMAWSIARFGDTPFAWRLPSACMGVLGLFAFGRMMWWASGRRFAALSGMILLGSDFAWLIQSRIAMLDMVMAGMAMLSLWMLAAAAAPRRAAHCAALAAGGGGDGAGPVAGREMERAAAGRADHRAADRHKAAGQRAQLDRGHDGRPPRRADARAGGLAGCAAAADLHHDLGAGDAAGQGAVPVFGLIDWHIAMAHLQSGIVKHHPYQSVWWQWVIDQRAIWYLYEKVDGAQRGIMLIGNPFIMLAGLPALVWCAYAGMARRDAAGRTAPCWRWRAMGRRWGCGWWPTSRCSSITTICCRAPFWWRRWR
jgi:hypothetical protein